MGFVARLRRGTNIINLNASPFTLSADWVPPTMAEIPQIAENRGKKARRVGERYTTRQLTASIHVQGTTIEYIRAQVDKINNFLKLAGKQGQPTYFEWKPENVVSKQVILGQASAYRSVEVLWGEMAYGDQYGWWDHSRVISDCPLSMVTGATIEGARQILAQAKGGISEDWVGMLDGSSRGLLIPEGDGSEGNWFTNPIFSNSTAWNTNWIDGAGMDSSLNTDPDYVIFGSKSARVASASDSTGTFYESINVGDTDDYVLSCYALRKDRGTLSATNCQLYFNGSALTTTFKLIGNGIYRLTAAVTGISGAASAGILIKASNVLYVDGFQLEKRTYVTPLMCGDFLGHAWTSAGHGSRSTRVASYVRYPVTGLTDTYTYTIRFAWVAPMAADEYIASVTLLQSSAVANFRLYLSTGPPQWNFMGSGTAVTSFSAGDLLIFHIVCDRGSYALYINGVAVETDLSLYYDPTSGYLYLGSSDTPDDYCGGIFKDFQIYDGALSAAEALADYNQIQPSLAADIVVSPISYIWTKDGDSVADYTFTGDGNYSNIAVIGGVPGSITAKTEIKATVAGMNNPDVYIGNLDVEYRRFIDPEFLTYEGSPDAKTINTSDSLIATLSIDDDEFLVLEGKTLAVIVRGDEDGSNDISMRLGINPGGAYYYSKYDPSVWIATSTSVSADLTPELSVVTDEELYRLLSVTRAMSVKVEGKRPTGSATLNLYSAQIMPFPMIRLVNTSASGIAPVILYLDGRAFEVNSSALSFGYTVTGSKNTFGLLPGRYNLLVSAIGKEGVATDSSDTLTYNAVYITPRWAIL